jgi:hypothetical protein
MNQHDPHLSPQQAQRDPLTSSTALRGLPDPAHRLLPRARSADCAKLTRAVGRANCGPHVTDVIINATLLAAIKSSGLVTVIMISPDFLVSGAVEQVFAQPWAAATLRSWEDGPLWPCGHSTKPGPAAARS